MVIVSFRDVSAANPFPYLFNTESDCPIQKTGTATAKVITSIKSFCLNVFITLQFIKLSYYLEDNLKKALKTISTAKSISFTVVFFPVEILTVLAAVIISTFIAFNTDEISVLPE